MQRVSLKLSGLNDNDIDWLLSQGTVQEITAGTVLVQENQGIHHVCIVLDGILSASVRAWDGQQQEVCKLPPGEIAGIDSFIDGRPSTTCVRASTPSQVLTISCDRLTAYLQQNPAFAAGFYRAVAIRLAHRLRAISTLLVRSKTTASQPLRKVLFVFSELFDSDIGWMISNGQQRSLPVGTQLMQEGQFADALYILLEGTLAVSVTVMIGGVAVSKEIARLAVGEMVGEMSFIDDQPPSATVKAAENSLVLALPRQPLAVKLQQDLGFAARFGRAMTVILVDRLRDRLVSHGYGRLVYNKDQPLNEDLEYEDELDISLLENLTLAGARFDWFLRQLREGSGGQ